MKTITLTGTELVKAPRDAVYAIASDFEKMPERFPAVAEKVTNVKGGEDLAFAAHEEEKRGRVIECAAWIREGRLS